MLGFVAVLCFVDDGQLILFFDFVSNHIVGPKVFV